MSRVPIPRESASRARRRARAHRGRGRVVQPWPDCRACVDSFPTEGCDYGRCRLTRTGELRGGAGAARPTGTVRRQNAQGVALQKARPRRRAVLATRW